MNDLTERFRTIALSVFLTMQALQLGYGDALPASFSNWMGLTLVMLAVSLVLPGLLWLRRRSKDLSVNG